ncbi:MAG: GNAT family N-acetyltransferase [Candidatus Onthomonas sp.]
MKIRLAGPEDAPALLAIYAQSINTQITFEYALPTEAEFRGRILETSARYPYLVAEEEGQVTGYAYAHALRERLAYQWTAELSIYLDASVQGRGLGKALYSRLLELLRLQGVRAVYGCVTAPNPASEALHRSLGFQLSGAFHRSGYKNGQWWDVLWFEKVIGDYGAKPETLLPFPQLEEARVRAVLSGERAANQML